MSERCHIVVDFSFIYYKYYFSYKSGRLKKLTANVDGEQRDVSMLYYCIKEVESFRNKWAETYDSVDMTVCFDRKSSRKEENEQYKSGRAKSLSSEDIDNIDEIQSILSNAGYRCLAVEGLEADDIVYNVVKDSYNVYDSIIVYTIDKDLLVNLDVDCKVMVMRYKQKQGYKAVDRKNVAGALTEEFGTFIPYGALPLYLCTVGDKSDNIKGIKGFGNTAFSKLLAECYSIVADIEEFNNYEYTRELIKRLKGLNESQKEQAYAALDMVRGMEFDLNINFEASRAESTAESRSQAYSKYGFVSLI